MSKVYKYIKTKGIMEQNKWDVKIAIIFTMLSLTKQF